MSYANFKSLVTGRTLPWFFRETPMGYQFKSYEGPMIFECEIYKPGMAPEGSPDYSADITDFETNHKSTAIDIS